MGARSVVRLTISVVLLLAVLVAPGSTVAHGLAHSRDAGHLAEHRIDRGAHHDDAHDAAEHGARDRTHQFVDAADRHGDHEHSEVGDAVRVRADDPVVMRASCLTVPATRTVLAGSATVVPHAASRRSDPATGPPPRPRAPPAA
jgi:hypothetical protein